MSAELAARSTFHWALAGVGAPPRREVTELASLEAPTTFPELAVLAGAATARLHLAAPPWGDARPPGWGPTCIATSLAAPDAPWVPTLLALLGPPASGWDEVLRHALVGPALPFCPPALSEGLRVASPLTALLDHPAAGREDPTLDLAEELRRRPQGSAFLARLFAEPTEDPSTLRWRARVLDAARSEGASGREWALDVYELALAMHSARWARLVGAAWQALQDLSSGEVAVSAALAVASWWDPFRALHRSARAELLARSGLTFDLYAPALRLAGVAAGLGAHP